MAASDRGRSPSAGHSNHLRNSASASPHPPLVHSFNAADPSTHSNLTVLDTQPSQGTFHDPSFTPDFSQQAQYTLGHTYGFQEQQAQQQQGVGFIGGDFQQSQGLPNGGVDGANPSAFPSFDFNQTQFDTNTSLDPALLSDLDPSSLDVLPSQPNMAAALQSHSPTPPHLAPEMAARRHSGSPSPHASPPFQQSQFQSMARPRNTSESLDPSSAMFPGQPNEWMNMGAYRSHKRSTSDNLSDISSNHPSPYMPTLDSFDAANAQSSPLLNPSNDPSFNDGLGLQGFSLSENQTQVNTYPSPGHSPGHSPHLMPQAQHVIPSFSPENSFGPGTAVNGQFHQQQQNTLDMFPGAGQEPFPSLNQQGLSPREVVPADHMSPPEISIEYAPSVKPAERIGPDNNSNNALSPPLRSRFRLTSRCSSNADSSTTASRVRAKSDSYAGSRPSSPAFSGRGRSPSLQPQVSGDSLSPFDNQPPSRSTSPGRGRSGSGSRGRSSSNASDQRDYILDLADPKRTPSNGADNKRVQKHPATFQCTLCPKRFTRAYNLRSHLRTHTDERPFVCTVCGKAFARQHDRKRHEGLHSGEKKFVCRGQLQTGAQWGCGRRFARADALGRHFRSEAGRVCIRPLLDEEAAERQKAWMEQQQQAQVAAGLVAPQPLMAQPQVDMMGSFFPAALIQQYPALAAIDWNTVPSGPPPDEEYISGRSSFDASSGGEYYEDMSENEMNPYQDQNMTGMNNINMPQHQLNVMPTHGGAQVPMLGSYGAQTGDYLSDFEGR